MKSKIIAVFLIICGLMLANVCQAISLPYANSRFVKIDGIQLHYRVWVPTQSPAKGTFLLIHGFSGSTFSWNALADSLVTPGYEVVAVDVPSFGYSDKSSKVNQSTSFRARLLFRFLDEVMPRPAYHLAGHSMGGGIVQAMALMEPSKTERLILVAPALFTRLTEGEVRRQNPWLAVAPIRNFVENAAHAWFITPSRIKKLLATAYGITPSKEQVMAYYRLLVIDGTASAILASASNAKEVQSLETVALSTPIFAIWGEADTWVPLQASKPRLELLGEPTLFLIPGAGHNPMETHFEDFWKLLDW